MPLFSTAQPRSLSGSISRMFAGDATNPLQEIAISQAAARTNHENALTTKLRMEAEALRAAQTTREDPNVATEYASHNAGIDLPTGNRLANHLRGVMEQPSQADIDDANIAGVEAKPFVTGAPNVDAGQRRTFQSALSALIGNRVATGKTNADQLAHAAGRTQDAQVQEEAIRAGDAGNMPRQNRLVSAARGVVYTPFRTNAQGTVLDQGTGDLAEDSELAGKVRNKLGAQASAASAAAGASSARRDYIAGPQTNLTTARTTAVKEGKPPTPVAAERITRMVDMSATSEFKAEKAAWEAMSFADKKKTPAPTFASVRERVAGRYATSGAEIAEAEAAIAAGAPEEAVRARFKQRRGFDLPKVAGNRVAAKAAPAAAADDPEEDD